MSPEHVVIFLRETPITPILTLHSLPSSTINGVRSEAAVEKPFLKSFVRFTGKYLSLFFQ